MDKETVFRKEILQSVPVYSDDYIKGVLHLPADSEIVSKIVLNDSETDTTRIIKLIINWIDIAKREQTNKLFLKLPIIEKQENPFDKWTKHEIDFYKNVDKNRDLPLVNCYDAFIFDDKKLFLLMLEDVSDKYCSAGEINTSEMNIWLRAAESLAKLHSYYWDKVNLSELKPLHGDNKTPEEKIINYQNALEKFLPYASDYYDKDILEFYNLALEDAIQFEKLSNDRRVHNNNITVIHGDSHIFNFMFPKEPLQQPLIVDFQFWRIGIAAVDIMNLTRVAFPFTNEPEHYIKIIKHYHKQLLEYGVTNYSLKECIYDFYLSTAMAVFGPVFNYFDFGLGHEYWGQGVYDTMNNYKTAKGLLNNT